MEILEHAGWQTSVTGKGREGKEGRLRGAEGVQRERSAGGGEGGETRWADRLPSYLRLDALSPLLAQGAWRL